MSLLTPKATLKPATKPATKLVSVSSGRGLLIALLSNPSMGKSSLLSQFPNVHFICDSRDTKILDLMDYSEQTGVALRREQVEVVTSFIDLCDAVITASKDPEVSTIVIESLVGVQALATDHCMNTDYGYLTDPVKAKNGFINYRNGHEMTAMVYFQKLLDCMLAAQTKGKNVFITGHTKLGTAKSITVGTEDFIADIIECSPEIARRLKATIPNILHIGATNITQKAYGQPKAKATGESTSTLYCTQNPHFPAQNCLGVYSDIEFPRDPKLAYQAVCDLFKLDLTTGKRR